MLRRVRALVVSAAVVVSLAATTASSPSVAAEPLEVTRVAGSSGEGPALSVSMSPVDVALDGDRLLVADGLWGVVREIDVVSRVGRVLYRSPSLPGPFAGDQRLSAPLPMSIAVDGRGDVIVGLAAYHQVVRIDDAGSATVVAGTGRRGYTGDGGPGNEATLAAPAGVAVEPDGAVLIADRDNHAVRRVAADGTITTVAGVSEQLESCSGWDGHYRVEGSRCPVPGSTGDGGKADAAHLDAPDRVRVGPDGALYVASHQARALRRITADGLIGTVAAGGAPFQSPDGEDFCSYSGDSNRHDVAVLDVGFLADGTVLVSEGLCVHRLDPDREVYSPFAGGRRLADGKDGDGGPAAQALLRADSIVAGPDGVFIAEPSQGRVRRIDPLEVVSTFAGTTKRSRSQPELVKPIFAAGTGGPALSAQLPATSGLAVAPAGDVYINDRLELTLRRFAVDGHTSNVTEVVGEPITGDRRQGTPAALAGLDGPMGLTAEPDGSLLIADGDRYLHRLSPDGILRTIAGGWECREDLGEGDPALEVELHGLVDVAVDPRGGLLLVEGTTGHVRHLGADGRLRILFGPRERSCDNGVWEYDSVLQNATAIAATHDGLIWVTTPQCLYRLTREGVAECAVELTAPGQQEDSLAAYERQARHGGYPPAGRPDLVVTGDGSVVFSDPHGHVIRRLRSDATVEVVAGDGLSRCSEDGAAATSSFVSPSQLAIHPDGSLLVADAACHTVHRVGPRPAETVLRAAGTDRLATSAHVSRTAFADGAAAAVVLARSDDYADALSGTPLAISKRAPLLLTARDALSSWTESELRRVLPRGGSVYLLGGEAALGPRVTSRLEQLGYPVVRLAGRDRFSTAVRVAEQGLGAPRTVLLTTGTNFPDALSAARAAAARGGAVLLTSGRTMAKATAEYLSRHQPTEQIAIGGPAAVAAPKAEAIVGRDRYETSAAVARRFFVAPQTVAVATGANFPDALSGGAALGAAGSPLLLTPSTQLAGPARDYLAAHHDTIRHVLVLGGETVVSTTVRSAAVVAAR